MTRPIWNAAQFKTKATPSSPSHIHIKYTPKTNPMEKPSENLSMCRLFGLLKREKFLLKIAIVFSDRSFNLREIYFGAFSLWLRGTHCLSHIRFYYFTMVVSLNATHRHWHCVRQWNSSTKRWLLIHLIVLLSFSATNTVTKKKPTKHKSYNVRAVQLSRAEKFISEPNRTSVSERMVSNKKRDELSEISLHIA